MPYSNLPEESWEKMDRCVADVQQQGKSKEAAIAICYSSIMGKKVKGIRVVEGLQSSVGGGVQLVTPLCNARDCGAKATWRVTIGDKHFAYCDKDIAGALKTLDKHGLRFEVKKVRGEWVQEGNKGTSIPPLLSIQEDEKGLQFITNEEGRVIPIGGPGQGGGGDTSSTTARSMIDLSEAEVSILQDWPDSTAKMVAEFAIEDSENVIGVRNAEGIQGVIGFSNPEHDTTRTPFDTDYIEVDFLAAKQSGQGVGSDLMNEVIALAASKNSGIHLFADEGAIPFYQKIGMQKAGDSEAWLHFTPQQVQQMASGKSELNRLEPENGVFVNKRQSIKNEETKAAQSLAESLAAAVNRDDVPAALIQSDILDPWQTATMGTPLSDKLQKTIAKTFGHGYPKDMEELEINWDLIYVIGEIYNRTQDWLKEHGFSEYETIPVYHPYLPSAAAPKKWKKGQEVRIKLNPATSWSLDIQEAAKVASFLASPGTPAFVLKTFIPVKSIISLPQTGFGMEGTKEVVLAGGEYEAIVEIVMGAGK